MSTPARKVDDAVDGHVNAEVDGLGHPHVDADAPVAEGLSVCRIGAGLLAARPPTRRSGALAVSIAAHVGVLVAVSMLCVSTPPRAQIEERAVLVRLPRAFARPAPVAARAESKPSARRRPLQKLVIPPPLIPAPVPTPIIQPTPAPEPEAVPTSEPVAAAPEEASEGATEGATEDAPIRADEGPAADVAPPGGVIGGTGAALEIGQVAQPPVLLAQEKPEYPRGARFDRIEGRVMLRAVIGVDGRIEPDEIRVLHSIPALDAAAITALRAWRFSPGRDAAGKPVRVLIEIPFEFSLR